MNQKLLKEILEYNKDTGQFTWKKSNSNRVKIGEVAGTKNNYGYIGIGINGKIYAAHRLAWLYSTGEYPIKDMDHINGIKDDNRICNLREATTSQNLFNQGKQKHNTSGFKGVCYNKRNNKWIARIKFNKKSIYLGEYNTAEQAAEAYKAKALELHGEFAKF